MTQLTDETFLKNIKKNIYAKSHIAKIIFPPGLGASALDEAHAILNTLWLAKKFTGEIHLLKNEIQVRSVYLLAIIELLLRNHCFSDVRLVIFKQTVIGKKAFIKKMRDIAWDYYLNKKMTIKVKVNSIASIAFHETALKTLLTDIVRPYVNNVVSGEDTHETTSLYAEFYKNKLTLSISLAGQPLYKRGYRASLNAAAPLREDMAAGCIRQALLFAKQYNSFFSPTTILIPFSGTGTFALEYYQIYFQMVPALLERAYALQCMPFFRRTHFDSLIKKAQENAYFYSDKLHQDAAHFICIDPAPRAQVAFEENIICFEKAKGNIRSMIDVIQEDFFKIDFNALSGDIFMPLNPPYGIRLNNTVDTVALYKKIANKTNQIAQVIKKNKRHLLGLILCPTETSWSAFIKTLMPAQMTTYHITQGGLDIRVCQFFI